MRASPLVWCGRDLNTQPPAPKADYLPTELSKRSCTPPPETPFVNIRNCYSKIFCGLNVFQSLLVQCVVMKDLFVRIMPSHSHRVTFGNIIFHLSIGQTDPCGTQDKQGLDLRLDHLRLLVDCNQRASSQEIYTKYPTGLLFC